MELYPEYLEGYYNNRKLRILLLKERGMNHMKSKRVKRAATLKDAQRHHPSASSMHLTPSTDTVLSEIFRHMSVSVPWLPRQLFPSAASLSTTNIQTFRHLKQANKLTFCS